MENKLINFFGGVLAQYYLPECYFFSFYFICKIKNQTQIRLELANQCEARVKSLRL